jgi:hypothetical protein
MLLVLTVTSAQAAEKSAPARPQAPGTFQVKASKGYLSVDAREAPLTKIFEEIGKQAGIVVESGIGPEQKITIQFDRVPLEDAIKKLSKNVSIFYTQDPKDNRPRIVRVAVLPEGKQLAPPLSRPAAPAQASKTKEPAPKPEPFKFEFDPGKSAEQEKPRKQP